MRDQSISKHELGYGIYVRAERLEAGADNLDPFVSLPQDDDPSPRHLADDIGRMRRDDRDRLRPLQKLLKQIHELGDVVRVQMGLRLVE